MNYASIDPLMGVQMGLKAFVAAVLGGIGNLAGAALGGLIIGLLENVRGRHPRPVELPRWHRVRDLDFNPDLQTRWAARQINGGKSLMNFGAKRFLLIAIAVAAVISFSRRNLTNTISVWRWMSASTSSSPSA